MQYRWIKSLSVRLFVMTVVVGCGILPWLGCQNEKLSFSGRVVNSDGVPVADAEILYVVELDVFGRKPNAPESVGRTAPDGTFRFEISVPEPQKWARLVIIATHRDDALGWHNLSPQSATDVELQLGTPTRISGRIMNEAAEPIQNAEVLIHSLSKNNSLFKDKHCLRLDDMPIVPVRTNANGDFVLRQLPQGMTDSNGRFLEIELIVGNEYVISAGAKGYQRAQTETFIARMEMTAIETLILPVAGQFFIEGQITDTAGEPVQRASIYTHMPRPWQDWRTQTDENGDYRLDTLPMELISRLQIDHPKYAHHVFKGLKTNQRHDLVLVKADGYLIGKVVDADGKPIVNASVGVHTQEESTTGYKYDRDWTNVHGKFELEHIKDTVVSLSVTKKCPSELYYIIDHDNTQIFKDIAVNQRNLVLALMLDKLRPRE
jgi:hypothetical protein